MRFKDGVTAGDMYRPAMTIEDQTEADEWLEACVKYVMRWGYSREEAVAMERENLAYFAGYYDTATRERVERLFRCRHPIFGPAARGEQ